MTYGSGGTGSISHIVGEAFAKAADITLLHVPYKGNGPALIDLTGGHVNLLFDGFVSSGPVAQQGRARLLGVSGKKRSRSAPTVPTFVEQGLARLRGDDLEQSVRTGGHRRIDRQTQRGLEQGTRSTGRPGAPGPGRVGTARTVDPRAGRRIRTARSAPSGCRSCACAAIDVELRSGPDRALATRYAALGAAREPLGRHAAQRLKGAHRGGNFSDCTGPVAPRHVAPLVLVNLGVAMHATIWFMASTMMPSVVHDLDAAAFISWATSVYLVTMILGGVAMMAPAKAR